MHNQETGTARRWLLAIGLAVVLSLGVAACGGSDSSSTEASADQTTSAEAGSTSSGSSGVSAEVEEVLEEATAPVQWDGPTEPAPAAANKHVAAIGVFAADDGVQKILEGAEAAGAALGWKVTTIDGQGTPQGFEAAVDQALNENVDGVYMSGISPSVIPNGMKELIAAGIPVVDQAGEEPTPDNGVIANVGTHPEREAKQLSAFVASDSGGSGQVLMIADPEFPSNFDTTVKFQEYLAEDCPGCEVVSEFQMQYSEVETELGPKIGNLLQKYPTVNYIYIPFDAPVTPAVAAVKQAGLQDDVKVVSTGGNGQVLEFLRNEEVLAASSAPSMQWYSWEAFDILNRTFNGQKIPDTACCNDGTRLLTPENVPPKGEEFTGAEAEFEKHYEELWAAK